MSAAPKRVDVGAAEEKGLHVHLLDMELVFQNALVHELMARVEAARVADHGDEPASLLLRGHRVGVLKAVRERDLDLHMLACLKALKRLRGVHLRRRRKDHGVEPRNLEGVGEIGRDVADPVLRRRLPGLVSSRPTSDTASTPSITSIASRCEAEGPRAGERDFEGSWA